MTNIVEEVQLDYCDVMIKPKRSTLNSRSEPNIYRTYKMKYPLSYLHSQNTLFGNGLMVSNMATTGTFKMAEVMAKNLMFTCLHKHYTVEELKEFFDKHDKQIIDVNSQYENPLVYFKDYVFVSTGIKDGDYEKTRTILNMKLCNNLCIDIANGYIPKLRTYNYPQSRVTDHRIGWSMHNLPAFMDGDIEECIEALQLAENAEKLKASVG